MINEAVFALESDRLLIQPLTYAQVLQYQAGAILFQPATGVPQPAYTVPAELVEVLADFILPNLKAAGAQYYFHTLWLISEKQAGHVVGSFLFKGRPDAQGRIEIGYGTEGDFQGRGYMTEALATALQWADSQPEIIEMHAETEVDNLASIQVLKKNNFEQCGQKGNLLCWRKPCQ